MIMGPNGTGKSTVVCALCLGLNGNTNLLGRAKEIGEFVKRGTNKAVIELELFNPAGRNYVLRREIMRQGNRSHFTMNNLPIKSKEVTQFVAEMNIQISNLCQFLPQEKVVEFSQMNYTELLEKTEQAVGERGLYEDHQTLKECRVKEKELLQHLNDKEIHLKKLQQLNDRVEHDVQRFNERQTTLEKIETLEKKKVWLHYDQKRILFEKCKKEKKKVDDASQEKRRQQNPLQEKLQKATNNLRKLEQQMKDATTEIMKQENLAKRKRADLGDLTGQIAEVQEDLREKKGQEQERLKKIHEWKQQVDGYKKELGELEPDENIKPQLEANLAELNRLSRESSQIEAQCSNVRSERENMKREIRGFQGQLKKLNDLRDRRLQTLRGKSPDLVNAVMWLRSNRDKFKKTIHEPIALVLNIEDKNHAKFIERAIPNQDMLAFVCEDSDDQDKFLSEVREKQKLRVSVVKSPAEPLDHFKAPRPIQDIGFGFYSYLKDLVTAPDAVMSYLCKLHKLHTIPLGNEETERCVEQVIEHAQLHRFYTPRYQYSIKQSRYGNRNKSSLSSQVPEAKILGMSTVDVNEKRELEMQIQEKEKAILTLQKEYADYERQHRELNARIEELKQDRQKLNRSKNQRRTITQNIKAKLESIKKKEAAAIDLRAEKMEVGQRIKKINNNKLAFLKKIHELNKVCLDKAMQKVSLSLQYEVANRAKVQCENKMRELQADNSSLETQLQDLVRETDQVKREAKDLLKEARMKTGSDKPSDHLRQLFDQYPGDLDKLEDMIHREQAQADCQYPTDESVVRDYKKRQRDIRDVKSEVSKKQEEVDTHRTRITELKETWLVRLRSMVQQINRQVSEFFSRMGCAGEVDLYYENEEDYDKYQIRIRVKFRQNEKLQLLTSTYQSGGERSVATILYLMALQELNVCPFRVVDEINQGMDPRNERKVFEFVVETACRANTSQYFLITPKLLPNLKYGPKMKILCIYNSHWMVPHDKWKMEKFIRKKKEINRHNGHSN